MQTQSRSDALVAAYIEQNPNHPDKDEVRLKTYGVSVWAIVGYWKTSTGDLADVAAGYDVPVEAVEAVEAALAYYHLTTATVKSLMPALT